MRVQTLGTVRKGIANRDARARHNGLAGMHYNAVVRGQAVPHLGKVGIHAADLHWHGLDAVTGCDPENFPASCTSKEGADWNAEDGRR